jgi:hypothetical protein
MRAALRPDPGIDSEAMSYYPFVSSRGATILHHRKRVAEAMWGRLLTCG